MLNNYFEYLLSDLLSYHYDKFQGSLNEKIFNLNLKEINEYESIQEAVKAFITKEVEAMMVSLTFEQLLNHFESELGVDNEKGIVNWGIIAECRERRHLIVHNSSLVNKKYLTRTKNPYKLNIGDTVHITSEYFIRACNEFYLAGVLLSYNCWGKWDKSTASDAVYAMMQESFSLLQQKEYGLVSRLTEYSKKIEPRSAEEEDLLMRITFNRLISLKKIGDSNFNKELKKVKVGTASPIFKLAYAVLAENHKGLIALVKQAKVLDDIDLDKYLEWPIYDFVRESDNSEIHEAIMKELMPAEVVADYEAKQLSKTDSNSTLQTAEKVEMITEASSSHSVEELPRTDSNLKSKSETVKPKSKKKI